MSDPDKDALVSMIDGAIAENQGSTGTCSAHGPLSRAVIVLLRCQRAQMHQRSIGAVYAGVSGTIGAGVMLGIVEALKAILAC